jgi:hypothetical protein
MQHVREYLSADDPGCHWLAGPRLISAVLLADGLAVEIPCDLTLLVR